MYKYMHRYYVRRFNIRKNEIFMSYFAVIFENKEINPTFAAFFQLSIFYY